MNQKRIKAFTTREEEKIFHDKSSFKQFKDVRAPNSLTVAVTVANAAVRQ